MRLTGDCCFLFRLGVCNIVSKIPVGAKELPQTLSTWRPAVDCFAKQHFKKCSGLLAMVHSRASCSATVRLGPPYYDDLSLQKNKGCTAKIAPAENAAFGSIALRPSYVRAAFRSILAFCCNDGSFEWDCHELVSDYLQHTALAEI